VRIARAYGVARSLVTYYGQPWRNARRRAFYGQFLGAGDLAFDVGSHVGDRIRTWRALGARVVAVEPQPDFVRVLRAFYGRKPGITILPLAIGAREGSATLHVSSRTPTVSTLARDWVADVTRDPRFSTIAWDRTIDVEVTTLDALVARFGEPAFVKVDVEGMERAVLDGLSRPVRAVSFEYIPMLRERSHACVDRLAELGDYRFRPSPVETTRWGTDDWLAPAAMKTWLDALPDDAGSGDVYARLPAGRLTRE